MAISANTLLLAAFNAITRYLSCVFTSGYFVQAIFNYQITKCMNCFQDPEDVLKSYFFSWNKTFFFFSPSIFLLLNIHIVFGEVKKCQWFYSSPNADWLWPYFLILYLLQIFLFSLIISTIGEITSISMFGCC